MPVKMEEKTKEPEGNYLNIDRFLNKDLKNRVARIGIELEGAWAAWPAGANPEPDGSVFRGNKPAGMVTGELPIGPIQPVSIGRFMRKYYPQKVDASCGMHVHMSFVSLRHYALLMEPEYQDTIKEYVTRWAVKEGFAKTHHIFDRLSGNNVFCQNKYWPDAQVQYKKKDHDQQRHGHRYTMVHYCGRQNTIEVRVLPMMATVDQAIRAVRFLLDVTNASLIAMRQKEQKIRDKIIINNTEVYEEFLEEQIPLTAGERRILRGVA